MSDSDVLRAGRPLPGWLFRETSEHGGAVELLASECSICGALAFPQSSICPECQSERSAVVGLSPIGELYAVTVVRIRPPDYTGPVPYALGLVELPERLQVFSVVLSADVDSLTVGTPVRVCSFDVGGDPAITSFAFRPLVEVDVA